MHVVGIKASATYLAAVISRRWQTTLALPLVTLVLVVVFWQSQLFHYTSSTKGVLYMWLVAGLIFVLLQISLLVGGLRKARSSLTGDILVETSWNLSAQVIIMLVAAIYNLIALAQITLLGVRPRTLFDALIGLILAVTIIVGIALYRHRLTSPQARLLYATGSKAAPQWLQAGSLALFGSSGLHVVTITAILAMGFTRFLLAKEALKHFIDDNTCASYKAAFRDLLSIVAMGVGWFIGIF